MNSTLQEALEEYRYKELRSACVLNMTQIRESLSHNLATIQRHCVIGRLIALDETVLATESKAAKQLKLVAFLPDKPHPLGMLARGMYSKMLYSERVLFLYGTIKDSTNTGNAKKNGLTMVRTLEQTTGGSHVVLIDSNFPTASFLDHQHPGVTSTFVCSSTKSPVSGKYNRLSDLSQRFISSGDHVLLENTQSGVLASVHNSAGRAIVIVINSVKTQGMPPPKRSTDPLKNISFDLAVAIATLPVEDPDQFAHIFNRPLPTDPSVLSSTWQTILHYTGHNITEPLDGVGHVTEVTLNECSRPHLLLIAERFAIPSRITNKKDLVHRILAVHPKASEEHIEKIVPKALPSKKRKALPLPATRAELRNLKDEIKTLQQDLLETGPRPEFHRLYHSNYGLQDRFNATLYLCFRFQHASEPMQTLTWFIFIIFLINSHAIHSELKAEKEPQNVKIAHTALFCLAVVRDIVKTYMNRDVTVSSDVNLDEVELDTEEDVAQYCQRKGAPT